MTVKGYDSYNIDLKSLVCVILNQFVKVNTLLTMNTELSPFATIHYLCVTGAVIQFH